jgi:DNA invertase Pin-like site-specific DNA recombinase
MKRQCVELWTVRSRHLDRLRAVLEGERANDESERKSQAVKAGIERSRAKGKPWGALIGYTIDKQIVNGDVVAKRVIEPSESKIVQTIFNMLDRGATTGAVARKLNQAGHR